MFVKGFGVEEELTPEVSTLVKFRLSPMNFLFDNYCSSKYFWKLIFLRSL
jgi:hypothetical protein